jgi:hypothetical protein
MAWSHSPEVKAAVRELVERTEKSFAEIGAETGVGRSTVSEWTTGEGWQRPQGAFSRRPVKRAVQDAARRMLAMGVCLHDLALVMERNPEVVRRWRPPRKAAAPTAEEARAAPAQVAALYEALTAAGVGRDELVRWTPQALALVMAETVIGDLNPAQKAQALAHITASTARTRADAPAPGASPDNDHDGPATYDETNALIEELAQHLAQLGGRGPDEGARGEGLAGPEAVAD